MTEELLKKSNKDKQLKTIHENSTIDNTQVKTNKRKIKLKSQFKFNWKIIKSATKGENTNKNDEIIVMAEQI